MKKILIISSEYTGHGHKSVHTALIQGFEKLYKDKIECKVVNGFTFGGAEFIAAERLYNTCVKYFPNLWSFSSTAFFKPSVISIYLPVIV